MNEISHKRKRICTLDELNNYETIEIESVSKGEFIDVVHQLKPDVSDEDSDSEDSIIALNPSEFYEKFVKLDKETRDLQANAAQRSELWLNSRKYCITASSFGTVSGNNPYQTPEQFLKEKLWGTFQGNEATRFGTFHEPDAEASFLQWVRNSENSAYLETKGLLKSVECPWIGVSPDGFLHRENGTIDLVEYKCPAFKRDTNEHPYKKYTYNVPTYYMDQIQGIMGYLNSNATELLDCKFMRQAWFVVWQEKRTFVTKVPFDLEYYENSLFPKLRDFYFSKMLPALTHMHNGDLDENEVLPHQSLEV